ncbi:MAG: tetratricopeptide repeat protein, partial [Alphaproteobacteria bacterium]
AGQLDDALRDFDSAVSLDPGYGYAWTSRCNARRLLADRTADPKARRSLYEQALLDCEQAFAAGRLDEFLADTHEVRGLVHQGLGHVNAALDDFAELIRLRPDSGRARLTRADTLRLAAQRVTRPDEQTALLRQAAAEYQHAITVGQLGPAEVLAFYNRGLVRFQLRQLDTAIADFTRALDLAQDHPLLPYIYAGRAMALADAGSIAEAKKDVAVVSSLTKRSAPDAALDGARDYVEQRGL